MTTEPGSSPLPDPLRYGMRVVLTLDAVINLPRHLADDLRVASALYLASPYVPEDGEVYLRTEPPGEYSDSVRCGYVRVEHVKPHPVSTTSVEWGLRDNIDTSPVPPNIPEEYVRRYAAVEDLTVVKRTITTSPWEDA